MTIKEAREKAGLNRRELSRKTEIPYNTLCSWEDGSRECPEYVKRLVIKEILTDAAAEEKEQDIETDSDFFMKRLIRMIIKMLDDGLPKDQIIKYIKPYAE